MASIMLILTLLLLFGIISFLFIYLPMTLKSIFKHLVRRVPSANERRSIYLAGRLVQTPELGIWQAYGSMAQFVERLHGVFGSIRSSFCKDTEESAFIELDQWEERSDDAEGDISSLLDQLSRQSTGGDMAVDIQSICRVVSELECVGDSGTRIAYIVKDMSRHGYSFADDMLQSLLLMTDAVEDAYHVLQTIVRMKNANETSASGFYLDAEKKIHALKESLYANEMGRMEGRLAHYEACSFYLEIVSELERMGNYIVHASQALR